MSALSRRELFTGSLKKAAGKNILNDHKKIENPEVVIGKIVDFPVGKKKFIGRTHCKPFRKLAINAGFFDTDI